jgi:ketosteroid isomerase-like protein
VVVCYTRYHDHGFQGDETMAIEDDIRQASDRFYDALNQLLQGNPGAMNEVWSHGAYVSTMHPIGGREIGWEQVRQAWEQTSQAISSAPATIEPVTVSDLAVVRLDKDLAYTLGTEQLRATVGGQQVSLAGRATNIYHLENGEWKVMHHHVDAFPAEAVQGLMG